MHGPLYIVIVPGFPTLRKTGDSTVFLPSKTRFFEGQKRCFRIFSYFAVLQSKLRLFPVILLFNNAIHTVWLIRDTSIRDTVEFPRQTKGHMVEETICSDLAKGQFGFKAQHFCSPVQHFSDIVIIQLTWPLKGSELSQRGCHSSLHWSGFDILRKIKGQNKGQDCFEFWQISGTLNLTMSLINQTVCITNKKYGLSHSSESVWLVWSNKSNWFSQTNQSDSHQWTWILFFYALEIRSVSHWGNIPKYSFLCMFSHLWYWNIGEPTSSLPKKKGLEVTSMFGFVKGFAWILPLAASWFTHFLAPITTPSLPSKSTFSITPTLGKGCVFPRPGHLRPRSGFTPPLLPILREYVKYETSENTVSSQFFRRFPTKHGSVKSHPTEID